jgi:hypothetical protein
MIGVRAENQIVTLPALREIFARVINDMVCANRSRRVHIPRAADGSDLSPERFGNLDGKCTHTTGRAVDQNLLAWLDPPLITKTLKGSESRHWYGCRVLKRYVGWLERQFILGSARILGKRSGEACYPEDLVAWLKLLYVAPDRFNPPCEISRELCLSS